jgi:hypothetical protein
MIKFNILAIGWLDKEVITGLVETNQTGGEDADDGFISKCLPLALE